MALEQPKKRANGRGGENQQVHKKSIDAFGQRTSQYRGVTRRRWTGRYEAHLWDNSCKKEGQIRKGRQVYIGGYNMEEKAARAYDLAALKYWGPSTHINFTLKDYQEELVQMKNMSKQEYVSHLRRKSSGFSRGASIYRGVTRHHGHGRWQARIGRVSRNKDLYLGTFGTQEEAAEAYDIAAIKFRGANAVTNFSLSRYDVRMIMGSSTLLPGELARRVEAIEPFYNVSSVDTSNQQSNRSDWQMSLHEPQQRAAATSELLNQQSASANENHHSRCNSANLNGFFGMASGSLEQDMHNPNKVTNTTSWRYGKSNNALLPATQLLSGVSSNQLKNAIPMAQIPIFGAWSDD